MTYPLEILTYGNVGSDVQLLSFDRRVGSHGDRVNFPMVRRLCCKHRPRSEYQRRNLKFRSFKNLINTVIVSLSTRVSWAVKSSQNYHNNYMPARGNVFQYSFKKVRLRTE